MTKKNFIELADFIRRSRPHSTGVAGDEILLNQWRHDVKVLADFCQAQSPRFDRAKWLEYVHREYKSGEAA